MINDISVRNYQAVIEDRLAEQILRQILHQICLGCMYLGFGYHIRPLLQSLQIFMY